MNKEMKSKRKRKRKKEGFESVYKGTGQFCGLRRYGRRLHAEAFLP